MEEVWLCEMEDATWRFSTKELAEKCARFFKEENAEIYCEGLFDDEELLRRMEMVKKKN